MKEHSLTECAVYFRQCIEQSDVEWSSNVRIVEVTKQKPLRRAIPSFMTYFYVQFGLYDGFVHVIEDEHKVRQDFGAQCVAGMVGKVLFKLKRDSYSKQRERAEVMKKAFEPYKVKLEAKWRTKQDPDKKCETETPQQQTATEQKSIN